MQHILKKIQDEPKDFTYIGVGSAPHCNEADKLEEKYDQILPLFVREVIANKRRAVRIIHIDPCYDRMVDFLTKYFAIKLPEAIHLDEEQLQMWVTDQVEIIFLADRFSHKENEWFLEHAIDNILADNGYLVLQEYTGYNTIQLFKSLYDKALEKSLFKTHILFDVTYGTDEGCCTDMTKYRPITDLRGHFFNTLLYTVPEIKAVVGIRPQMDELILKYIRGKYYQALNTIHVDYRRRLKGDTVFVEGAYTSQSEPDTIMTILQRELTDYIDILRRLKVIKNDKEARLKELFTNYKSMDVYKWYDEVRNII